jgi:hypothetical protein
LRIKLWTFSMLLAALGGAAFLVPGAVAGQRPTRKPKPALKMLPKVGCEGLLTVADFPGTVSESAIAGGAIFGSIEEGHHGVRAFVTTCQYSSPEPTDADPEPEQRLGLDVLGVQPRIEFESNGKRHDLLLAFPKQAESTRYQLHGIGTRAFFEIGSEGDSIGYLQVRNDVFYVAKEGVGGIKSLLATVASELCKSCNEAEVPKSAGTF